MEAWGVDNDELRVRSIQDSASHVPRRLWSGRGDGDLFSDQRIEQRRFPGVWPADEGGEPRTETAHTREDTARELQTP